MIDATALSLLVLVAVGVFFVMFVVPKRLNKGHRQGYYKAEWLKIEALRSLPHGGKLAVIEADKLLDSALRDKHVKGDTTGERLRSANGQLSSINELWTAHKLRNTLVHETGAAPSEKQVLHALQTFRRALRELGAL